MSKPIQLLRKSFQLELKQALKFTKDCYMIEHFERTMKQDFESSRNFQALGQTKEKYESLLASFKKVNQGNILELNHVQQLAYARKGPERERLLKKLYPIKHSQRLHFPPPPSPVLFKIIGSDLCIPKAITISDFEDPTRFYYRGSPMQFPLERNRRWRWFLNSLKKVTVPLLPKDVQVLESIVRGEFEYDKSSELFAKRALMQRANELLAEIPIISLVRKPESSETRSNNEDYMWSISMSPYIQTSTSKIQVMNDEDRKLLFP